MSSLGLEVDKAKIEAIERLPPPSSIKAIRIVLRNVGFYRRFMKDFLKISLPLCNLLEKDVKFNFDNDCLNAFQLLKEKLISTPIIM